jgi:CHAT domain-containing protein/Tfp pilus assembly protein PilF
MMQSWFLLWLVAGAAQPSQGVVVEDVQDGFAAHAAGLRPGDILLQWERAATPPANPEPESGALASPFDLEAVELEQAERGEVTLSGWRDAAPIVVRMPAGKWRVKARPPLDATRLAAYREAQRLVAGPEPEKGWAKGRETAAAWRDAGHGVRATWLLYRLGLAAIECRHWDTAEAALGDAAREAESARDEPVAALVHRARGRAFEKRDDWARASQAYSAAIEAYRSGPSPGLSEAQVLGDLGRVARTTGDHEAALDLIRRALAIQEAVAPGGLDAAGSLHELGITAWSLGDIPAATEYHRRALAIREKRAPESLDVATSFNHLAIVGLSCGDLAAAADHYERALALYRRLAPEGVAPVLGDLAMLEALRGDLTAAEEYQRQALALFERQAPEGANAALLMNQLATVAIGRGDLGAAADLLARALAILDRAIPGGLGVATILHSLGMVSGEQGDLAAAEDYHRRALDIRDRLAPDGLTVAHSLRFLGDIALKQGKLAQARGDLERALGIVERFTPSGLLAADAMGSLGDVSLAAGDVTAAEAHYVRSLEIRRDLAPGSAAEAEACRRLAVLERDRGRSEAALQFYRCALDALETQRRRLRGPDEVTTRFAARYAGYYRETLALLMRLGHPEEAFHVLERYRARALLSLLAERDLAFSADVPPDLDRDRRLANAEYDRALARLSDVKADQIEGARQSLRQARLRQAEIQDRIRVASPRLAALQHPMPLDLAQARAVLDAGTLLLSFSVGDEGSYLFAVGPGPDDFEAIDLQTTLASLRDDTSRFRGLLQQGGGLRIRSLQLTARGLSDVLLAPVAHLIAGSRRLMIVPDGPLHGIPFAALADPTSPRFRYLIELRPLHQAASATVFAEIAKARRQKPGSRLIAFGDPDYSAGAPPDEALLREQRAARERGLDLRPLPASRREVRGLERLYGPSARTYLGAEATEERAKSVAGEASLLHFATHALADEKAPLDSSLALSLPGDWRPGRDNGLLQAWEIFEQVRLDADLVTLSACGTALGKEMSGEGILGLTRAFQYAGARSVLASLWGVSDASTADWMVRFYGRLKRGANKDDAVRTAQLGMMRRPGSSHPYHWAGFQLSGDWK